MPPLDTCVERLWLLSDAPAHSKERIAASGTIDLGINLHENEFRAILSNLELIRCWIMGYGERKTYEMNFRYSRRSRHWLPRC